MITNVYYIRPVCSPVHGSIVDMCGVGKSGVHVHCIYSHCVWVLYLCLCTVHYVHVHVCVTLTGSDQGEEGGKGKVGVSGNATRKKEGEGGGNGSTEGDTSNSPFATLSDEGRRLQCECKPLHVWVSMHMSF